MGHWEDKIIYVMEEVNRLGVQEEFNKETDRLRDSHPYMETRDLFEQALNNIRKDTDDASL